MYAPYCSGGTFISNNDSIIAPVLSPCDLKWIDLINQFNSVYQPKKSQVSLMEELISKYPADFKLEIKFSFEDNMHIATFENDNLGTFEGSDELQPQSKLLALTNPYQQLCQLSAIFSSFKTIFPANTEITSQLMDIFLSLNNEMIKVDVWPKSKIVYQASITMGTLRQFEALGHAEEYAKMEAFEKLVVYLKLYCERINSSPNDVIDNSIYERPNHGFTRYGPSTVPALPSSMCNKLMELICNFNEIYDRRQNVLIAMQKLIDMDQKRENFDKIFEFEYTKGYNRKGKREYSVKIKFISAIFTGNAPKQDEAEDNAKKAVYKRLLQFSEMFSYFKQEYVPGVNLEEFKMQIFIHHDEVLKLKVRKGRGRCTFNTTISLVHFCDFHGDSNDQAESEMLAFQKLIDYMKCLVKMVPKTKEELDKERMLAVVPISTIAI